MSGNEPDYYAILGVSRDAEAVVIKAAWRALVQKYHPDKFDGPADVAQKKTTEINRAYVVLSDSELRKEYDRKFSENISTSTPDGESPAHPTDKDDITDDIPESVKGWSWGAFFLNWIWAIGNKTWIGLLAATPYIGFIMAIILGFKGREWAWKNQKWDSVEHFNKVQRIWSICALSIVGTVLVVSIILAISIPAYKDYKKRTELVKNNDVELRQSGNSAPEIDWTYDPNWKPSASHEQAQQAADQATAQKKITEDHFSRIYAAHPDAKDIVSSQLFNQWTSTKTTDEINYIMFVIERGTADEVISMLDRFKSESWRATNKTQELAQKQSARQARCTKKAENELSFCQSQVPDEASEQFIGALGRCKTIANNAYDICMGNK